ncbi:MAG: DUF1893 domain-containing protein [Acetobacter sp.]|nr:DUF1893 domain-containing protein [Bacteroides sp.]MCM1341101.1 DUF1893 domain-containing protein [Acetobacter sp.]MCM1433566.1 DUF1893 domain-containing protein [Clostridiales bacterium]
MYSCDKRGVKPLLDWIDRGLDLKGFSAADKVVGNAAAFLYVTLGIKEIYANVVSRSAVETLEKYGIKIQYNELAEYIINRAGTGKCPMEDAVKNAVSPNEALMAIRIRLKELNQSRIQ